MNEIVKNGDVKRLEELILQEPQVDLNTEHCLSGGVYARTIHIPAGTVLTGATHKKDHINIVCGDISVTTDEGAKRLTGYCIVPTKAGMKRAGYAHTDTVWTTICATDLTIIEDIEDELVEESSQLQTRHTALTHTASPILENK